MLFPSGRVGVSTRWLSSVSEKLQDPRPEGACKMYSTQIENLAETISSLTLREASDLNELLKERLGISGMLMYMMAGSMPSCGVTQASQEEKPVVAAKTLFDVRLVKFDAVKKVSLIKEIKSLNEDMNLVAAKKFVEGAPDIVKRDLSKDEAEQIKSKLESCGGTVEIL